MISLPVKWWPQNSHFRFWNHHTLYNWLIDMCPLWNTLHYRILGTVTWCEANTSSQREQGPGMPVLLKRSLNISCFPKPPESQSLWLSFIFSPVSFKRDKLLELKLMCLCDYSSLLKLTEAETDESNQFVNCSKEKAFKAETKSIPFLPDRKI